MNALQTLARSNTAQTVYRHTKEIGSLRLFNNDTDLSHLQILYLYYLSLYESLYTDLQMGEEFISEDVIKDDVRVDAYLLYKRVNRKNKKQNANTKSVVDNAGSGSLIFRRGKSK
jgi:hypothetical protein